MLSEGGGVIKVLAQALFPNIDEIISLHGQYVKSAKIVLSFWNESCSMSGNAHSYTIKLM